MENQENESSKRLIITVIAIIIVIAGVIVVRELIEKNGNENGGSVTPTPAPTGGNVEIVGDYNIDLIRTVNALEKNTNYLVSPYNMEIALRMLKEGAAGETKEELEKVIGSRKINDISVPNELKIANGLFIRNKYKSNIKTSYMNTLKTDFNSEVLYDDFKSPKVINDWAKEKTDGMIEELLDHIDDDFIVGLASALALDVKWVDGFDCNGTTEQEFTKADNTKMKAEMMHKTYESNAKYIKTDDAEGIVIPYKTESSNVNLEFIALLPNSDVNTYVSSLTNQKLETIISSEKEAGSKLHINLSLPRFTYSYEVPDLINVLKTMGITRVFDPGKSQLSSMLDIDGYIGQAVHKTYIELSETGTKAAAITFFGVDKSSAPGPDEFELVNIVFNKPFVYMIREKNTGELLFFGTVFTPNEWKGSTCK